MQIVRDAGQKFAKSRQREFVAGDLGEIDVAERPQMIERRVDLVDLAGREHVHALLAVIDLRALPGGRTFDRRQNGHSVSPPSTMIVCPVIIAPPAHKKKIVSAMSSGLQARFSGVFSIDCALRSDGQSLFHGLSTKPGATALTRISGARVRARERVRLMRAALLVA